jgi:ribosomal protein S18 acetylase RimI-like enzyme
MDDDPGAGAAAIRPASPADLDALLAIEAASFPSDRLSRRSLRRFAAEGRLRVADDAGRPAGYALTLARRGGRSARLYSIAVAAEAAGRGIGRRLLADAEASARAAGMGEMRLEVRAADARARRFYTAAGYAPVAELPGYYADGADGLRLSKRLVREAAHGR